MLTKKNIQKSKIAQVTANTCIFPDQLRTKKATLLSFWTRLSPALYQQSQNKMIPKKLSINACISKSGTLKLSNIGLYFDFIFNPKTTIFLGFFGGFLSASPPQAAPRDLLSRIAMALRRQRRPLGPARHGVPRHCAGRVARHRPGESQQKCRNLTGDFGQNQNS